MHPTGICKPRNTNVVLRRLSACPASSNAIFPAFVKIIRSIRDHLTHLQYPSISEPSGRMTHDHAMHTDRMLKPRTRFFTAASPDRLLSLARPTAFSYR